MKRIFLCSVVMAVLSAVPAYSQWVVSDPALTQLSQITWAKELKQAYEQFKVLDKSRNILTESLDLYRQVSGVIKNSKMVLNVLQLQGEMLKVLPSVPVQTSIPKRGMLPIRRFSMRLWTKALHLSTCCVPSFHPT